MTAEKLKRTADYVRGQSIMITGYSNNPEIKEKLNAMLKDANLEKILVETCPDFFEWMETLSEEPVPGLDNTCYRWINCWGSGGGDCSTEDQIKGAIDELETYGRRPDVPKDLADAMYCSISEYSKTPFEASVLVMNVMNECLAECLRSNEEE